MWTIIKFDKNNYNFLKKDLKKKLGGDFKIYLPKLLIQKYRKNKLINRELMLLGDYLFCYHKKFENKNVLNSLKFTKGLKYFLNGFESCQKDIEHFLSRCKKSEDKSGYVSHDFYELCSNSNYKFTSGVFSETIFKIISLQKNKINILIGGIKTTISKKKFLAAPI